MKTISDDPHSRKCLPHSKGVQLLWTILRDVNGVKVGSPSLESKGDPSWTGWETKRSWLLPEPSVALPRTSPKLLDPTSVSRWVCPSWCPRTHQHHHSEQRVPVWAAGFMTAQVLQVQYIKSRVNPWRTWYCTCLELGYLDSASHGSHKHGCEKGFRWCLCFWKRNRAGGRWWRP